MIEGLVLVLAGAGVIVAMLVVLRSVRIRDRVYRSTSRVRSVLRLRPVSPETFVRGLEIGIYGGICFGMTVAILGVLEAAG